MCSHCSIREGHCDEIIIVRKLLYFLLLKINLHDRQKGDFLFFCIKINSLYKHYARALSFL